LIRPSVRVAAVLLTLTGTFLAAPFPADATAVACTLPPTKLITDVPWAQQRLGFDRAWPITRGGGVSVAVVDTGVDGRQPFLAGHVLPGADVINGGGAADTDCLGHGTFVAGLIVGQPRPGVGFSGVAPDAVIFPVRQTNTGTDGTAQTLADGIRAAVDAGANVINVSITVGASSPALADAVQYALARNVVIVAAAGNDAQAGDPAQFPAAYPGVIAVGAVDSGGRRASFSETASDVSVVAPGVDLIGPGAGGDGMVAGQQGTSFAAPFVSGVAALVRAAHPELTAAQVKHRIEATADHPAAAVPDPQLGYGVVNPYNAVAEVLPEELGATSTRPSGVRVALPTHPPERGPGIAALAAAGGTLFAAAVILIAAPVIRAGRRRGWRPGG
jgi:type VII secretion-associated serine protease mycosin